MDIGLDDFELIGGSAQVEQSVRLLLRNHVGDWCQSYSIGSYVNLHEASVALEEGVRKSLSALEFVKVKNVSVVGNTINVSIDYNGDTISSSVVL